jgi:GT2 family glycosyltransferase
MVPKASVIIVNHNGREYLGECLRSLLNKDRQDCEIILVDNASTDGSPEYVEQAFPEALVIRNEVNQGFGQGSNVGAQRAKGRYLAFLNQDTVVEPGWLEALIAALEADPKAGLATSKILLLTDPGRVNTCGNEMHYTGLTLCRGAGMDRSAFTDLAEVGAVSGAAFLVRKDVFEALGRFDETFFLYMEDTDLSWRARLVGYRCIYVPSSVVYHDYTLRFGPKKTFYQERNRYLMLLKGLRWRTLLLLLPALFLAEVVTWGFVLLRERRLTNKLRAYAWIVKHWSQVMESRRQVQARRNILDHDLISKCTHRLAYEQTGDDLVARLAHIMFDPLFFVLQRLTLALIWW